MSFHDLSVDASKPSLFELIAQEQLRDLLQPALKYVLGVFAQRYPRYLLRIVNKHEEFYALIMLAVEKHYLSRHGASFSENFYALKRRRRPYIEPRRAQAAVGGVPSGERLGTREIWRSLVFLVGLPYLRAKAQDLYEDLGGGLSSGILDEGTDPHQVPVMTDESIPGNIRRVFKTLYPWFNLGFESWLLVYNIAYLFDRTPFYRPWLSWIGVDLRRLGVEDLRAASLKASQTDASRHGSVAKRLKTLLLSSPQLTLDSLRLLLPTAIFFIKFLEWWYSPGSPAKTLTSSPLGPPIPPPAMMRPHPQGIPFNPRAFGICPICHKAMNNATALPSGNGCCSSTGCDYSSLTNVFPNIRTSLTVRRHEGILDYNYPSLDSPDLSLSVHQQFGKHIQSQQVPGWSFYYLDYKFLKKIISSLAANRPASEAAALAVGLRPSDVLSQSFSGPNLLGPEGIVEDELGRPPIFSSSGQDDERGADFRAHKAAFFFKLERELEKINAFYLQKEAELKLRLETLLSKRRAAALRGIPDSSDDNLQNHAEWSAVEEGFRLLERDLGKLQQFVEINATGFRKILKKFDKRSKSTTKELYLTRQVEAQPVFNRQLISELSDTVATCLLNPTDLSSGLQFEGANATDIFTQQIITEQRTYSGPFYDLEKNLRRAVITSDAAAIRDCAHYSDVLSQDGGKANVTRILWRVIIEAPPPLADLILSSLTSPFDFHYIDDINGRTCLHEAAMAGSSRLADICLDQRVQADKLDAYGRTALHYAAMNGHATMCRRLLQTSVPVGIHDADNYSALVYAILKGSVECVQILLESGSLQVGDIIPLSLAAQAGHVDVALMLLERGVKSGPNSNGEYPIHLAARRGHVEVCKLLLHRDGWDVPDKYHEWTPLFHAARYGHDLCVRVLLDAGSRVSATDELGHPAVHYAAWYGHHICVDYLLEAAGYPTVANEVRSIPDSSPSIAGDVVNEIDLIPAISLPPPIMPHRVYGHNYLDKSYLVQISIASSAQNLKPRTGVRLHHRRISPAFRDDQLLASAPLKLVMTTSAEVNSAPYAISLPVGEDAGLFAFQIPCLSGLFLEFSVYPNFGTKTIGRAVALPQLFLAMENTKTFTLPILDNRLHVIGEVTFEATIITPFAGVTLEVGGGVETYWKASSLVPLPDPAPPRRSHFAETRLSPSAHLGAVGSQTATSSSLRGEYLHLAIQVTQDLHPVIFRDWLVPDPNYSLGVADITLDQFEALALRIGRKGMIPSTASRHSWAKFVSSSMISLAELLMILPVTIDVNFDIIFPPESVVQQYSLGHRLNLNHFVDSVLRAISQASASVVDGRPARRGTLFTSFFPGICSALNWKQPNYPVFFSLHCTSEGGKENLDQEGGGVGMAVDFAKSNNLLGIFVDADILIQVPSLVKAIKGFGLLVGVHNQSTLPEEIEVDAYADENNVVFIERPKL